VNQLLALLLGPSPAGLRGVYLLELTNGIEKVLHGLEVGTQSPIQEHEQQRN